LLDEGEKQVIGNISGICLVGILVEIREQANQITVILQSTGVSGISLSPSTRM
jgi:hypothetical protein